MCGFLINKITTAKPLFSREYAYQLDRGCTSGGASWTEAPSQRATYRPLGAGECHIQGDAQRSVGRITLADFFQYYRQRRIIIMHVQSHKFTILCVDFSRFHLWARIRMQEGAVQSHRRSNIAAPVTQLQGLVSPRYHDDCFTHHQLCRPICHRLTRHGPKSTWRPPEMRYQPCVSGISPRSQGRDETLFRCRPPHHGELAHTGWKARKAPLPQQLVKGNKTARD